MKKLTKKFSNILLIGSFILLLFLYFLSYPIYTAIFPRAQTNWAGGSGQIAGAQTFDGVNDSRRTAFSNIRQIFTIPTANRAWQGIASDGTYLYVVSDRNSSFGLENIISKYAMDGTYITEKTSAYNPGLADFFSFGDATVIDGKLYVGAYNFNTSPRTLPLQSRIAVFNLADLSLIQDYNLGTAVGIAEGVDKHDGYFWVVDGNTDTYVIKKYDSSRPPARSSTTGDGRQARPLSVGE